ncbi:MAG: hypothetical protein L0241_11825 [Planctomycetia bacterium]|nr:hypothetical protein [Planctomycetia bacterium]
MTEAEWLACNNSWLMVEQSTSKVSDRKVQLFVCACCRRHWKRLSDIRLQKAVEVAEALAEGIASGEEARNASKQASQAARSVLAHQLRRFVDLVDRTLTGSRNTWANLPHQLAEVIANEESEEPRSDLYQWAYLDEQEEQMKLLRDIFGNPFRAVDFSSEWRTDTALSLARQMYESREFSAMPILADALQDAGCDNDDVLNHCRDAKQIHVRGCWVVDLVLGKE